MCGKVFRHAVPTSYRLTAAGSGYHWSVEGEDVASAVWRDGTWDIADADGRVNVTVIPVGLVGEEAERVAIVDHRGRMATTFAAADGIVRDSHGEPMLLVRSDGPTGLHVVDRDGVVLALGSRIDGAKPGLDVLVTPAGGGDRRRLVLGLSLALVLVRAADHRTPHVG